MCTCVKCLGIVGVYMCGVHRDCGCVHVSRDCGCVDVWSA